MIKTARKHLQEFVQISFPHSEERAKAHLDWQMVTDHHPKASSEYLLQTIDYHFAYLETAEDCSIVIYEQQQPIAVWPLTLITNNDDVILQSNCKAVLPPLINPNATKKQIKKIYQQCLTLMKAWYSNHSQSITLCYVPTEDVLWQRTFATFIEKASYQQCLLNDLNGSLTDIQSNFRKSYRSLVNKGKTLWRYELYENMSDELLEQFRQFHIKVAGKETRNKLTWKTQQAMINSNEAFFIALYDKENAMVGAALFNLSPLQASYSVGVYERSLFDQPLGHIVQYVAIEHMLKLGVNRYYLGFRHHTFEQPSPNAKESSIGFFKEGFSNQTELEILAKLVFN